MVTQKRVPVLFFSIATKTQSRPPSAAATPQYISAGAGSRDFPSKKPSRPGAHGSLPSSTSLPSAWPPPPPLSTNTDTLPRHRVPPTPARAGAACPALALQEPLGGLALPLPGLCRVRGAVRCHRRRRRLPRATLLLPYPAEHPSSLPPLPHPDGALLHPPPGAPSSSPPCNLIAVLRRPRLSSPSFPPTSVDYAQGNRRSLVPPLFLECLHLQFQILDLPELHGHDVFGPTTEGLLVLLDRSTYAVCVLNPFTRQVVKLPPATTVMSKNDLEIPDRIRSLLSVSGAGLADDCTIAVHFSQIRTVAIIKPGDVHWTVVDRGRYFLPAMSFAGRFYCATSRAVMVVETSVDQPLRLAIAAKLTRAFARIMMDTVHLVDNDGELMLVDGIYNANGNRKYEVYRVDLDARNMVSVCGFGGRAVFIGIEVALSILPSVFPSVRADKIYLGFDDLMIGMLDNSPINLMDGTAEPRQFEDSRADMPLYGPLCLEEYLSWSVTGYRDTIRDTV
ncbi:hypothetical protein HU200_025271 [Digitaria exilis]|uniref:KIB1-4 beta-propeller domain-containing protein n=1 Tax=Digitaria exilis TaxID=1010633 RepID=A0A835EXW1_9POAL|nr:hypothetical protein HU200_025271 [Digitaria exilis]